MNNLKFKGKKLLDGLEDFDDSNFSIDGAEGIGKWIGQQGIIILMVHIQYNDFEVNTGWGS